ncbi:MAG: trigger factor [Fimbriimonadales bacterium]|nr:trigger factor [Fimbriimonadales bacterium]
MKTVREDLNPCTVQLTVTCEPEEVEAGFERAYRKLSKKIKVPGFRPGKAPRDVVRGLIPKDDLYNEAAETIVRAHFGKAIEAEGLSPYSAPAVELRKLNEEQSECEFILKVPLEPKVELGDYKSLSARRPPIAVSEEDIDRQLETLRQRRATREPVEGRGAEDGDVAVVNIKPTQAEGDGRTFAVVVGQTFPELDEAVRGMATDGVKVCGLTFPANFQESDWAGQTLECQLTMRSLTHPKLPELDDAFAQSLDKENLEQLREDLRQQIAKAKEEFYNSYVNEQLLEMLRERSQIEVPDTMWEQVANQRLREIAEEQAKQGRTLEQYAAQQNMTLESLVEAQRNEAKLHVIRALMVRRIFEAEGLKLTNEDLNLELLRMSQEYGMRPEDLLKALRQANALNELQFRAVFEKVMQYLREQSEIVEYGESQQSS